MDRALFPFRVRAGRCSVWSESHVDLISRLVQTFDFRVGGPRQNRSMTNLADTLDAQAAEADEFVRRMIDARRAVAAAQAAEAAVLASASSWAQRIAGAISRRTTRDTDMTVRDLSAQIGAAIRLSDRTVQAQMSDASILLERFPATFEAWSTGRIDRAHMVVITDAGLPVSDDPGGRGSKPRPSRGRRSSLRPAPARRAFSR